MRIGLPDRVLFTYEVVQHEVPARGQTYVDPRGHHWIVRDVKHGAIALRDPPPEAPVWSVQLESNHPAYRLEPGDEIRRLFSTHEIADRREALTWSLRDIPGFEAVGVTEDGFSLLANFSRPVAANVVPSKINEMPVVTRVLGSDER